MAMASQFIRSLAGLLLLHGVVFAEGDNPLREPYPPRVGQAHPPLALWNLDHDDYISLTHFRGSKVLLIHFASWSPECRAQVTEWHEALREEIDQGKIVIVGVAYEQHPDRAKLFAQWKNLDGPMMQDPVNYTRLSKLPLMIGVDENGYVRVIDPDLKTFGKQFLDRKFPGEPAMIPENTEEPPNTRVTRRYAGESRSAGPYIDHGDAVVIAGLAPVFEEAVDFYGKAIAEDRRRADAHFGLGVVHRMRFESDHRQAGDFQAAVDAWGRAAKLAPDNAIYTARSEQYAPPKENPTPFYDWVDTARQEITERGDTPVALAVEPMGAELGGLLHRRGETVTAPRGDPSGKVARDDAPMIRIEQTVVRSTEKSRPNVWQVYLTFVPDAERGARWHNEAEPLRVWLRQPSGVEVQPRFREQTHAALAVNNDLRTVCFTISLADGARKSATVKGYALYHISGGTGEPEQRRQDFEIKLRR